MRSLTLRRGSHSCAPNTTALHERAARSAVIFAVAGHRDIQSEDDDVLRAAVRAIFERFRTRY